MKAKDKGTVEALWRKRVELVRDRINANTMDKISREVQRETLWARIAQIDIELRHLGVDLRP